MKKKQIHLVCNAHLDPVWQWPWEDGLTEALSTFRSAADFCCKYERFVFNHNESILYRWVQEFEPQLFKRIQQLVKEGKWRISGGAYLQPDVNNTSGESHIRQYLYGRSFFEKYFGRAAYPLTAHNYDSFGHAEGLPQVLKGCGMRHYIFCRPDFGTWSLPVGVFIWRDRSGASVVARRSDEHYPSFDNVKNKLQRFIQHYSPEPVSLILWGIGNHGGGPSEEDYRQIQQFREEHQEIELINSTADRYFAERLAYGDRLPEVRGEFQNSAAGCYTSMSRVKRAHRAMEDLICSVERLAALGWWHGCIEYPEASLQAAWKDILFAEFHDILPGSCSRTGEQDSLRMLDHAGEILHRERVRCLLPILSAEKPAEKDQVPVFVRNPHGFAVRTQIEFELNLAHMGRLCRKPVVTLEANSRKLVCQRLHAESAAAGDWRVRMAAEVNLKPWEIMRIDESYRADEWVPPKAVRVSAKTLTFCNRYLKIKINPQTGLVDWLSLSKGKKSLVQQGSFVPVALRDLDHSWRCGTPRPGISATILDRVDFVEDGAYFRLATPEEALSINPPHETKWQPEQAVGCPLRITEDGPLRTMIEALFVMKGSALIRTYVIGKRDDLFEIRDRVVWNQRDTMLKLHVPLAMKVQDAVADAVYSAVVRQPSETAEQTNQRWLAVRGKVGNTPAYLGVASTGSCAYSLNDSGDLRLNVLRSPAYASFNLKPQTEWYHRCYMPRHDIGEHEIRYAISCGGRFCEADIRRRSALLNMPPDCLVYYPQPEKISSRRRSVFSETLKVDDEKVQIVAVKRSEDGKHLVVRLLNTSTRSRKIQIRIKPYNRKKITIKIDRYGLQTVLIRRGAKTLRWYLADLVERKEDNKQKV